MRLAALAILVTLLVCYANHMVRVGARVRQAAAEFAPHSDSTFNTGSGTALVSPPALSQPPMTWESAELHALMSERNTEEDDATTSADDHIGR